MNLNIFKYWFSIITFIIGFVLAFLLIHYFNVNLEKGVLTNESNNIIDIKIRLGEIITWFFWITLYFGTPFFLKRFVDDEREVKKMIIEEVNLAIKQSDLIAGEIYNLIDKAIEEKEKKSILTQFEILERYVSYVNEQIPKIHKSWAKTELENRYFKYKDIITSPITSPIFIIDQQFYSRQLVDLKNFQQYLKDAKITVMRS